MRNCTSVNCSEKNPQPLTNYGIDNSRSDRLRSNCKACCKLARKEYHKLNIYRIKAAQLIYDRKRQYLPERQAQQRGYHLKIRFNISVEEYNKLFERQKGCCSICDKHQTNFKYSLCVDHDHNTKKIRGLLCKPCNSAIGMLEDDLNLLENAKSYLNCFKLKLVDKC